MKVSAKTKKYPTPIAVDYNVPATLGDLTKAFGEEVVVAAAKGAIVISLQAFMRRHIEKAEGKPNVAELQKAVSAWKPDVRTVVKQTAFEKVSSNISKLSPEERRKLLAELQKAA